MHKIIIDTDPGIDDVMAIFWSLLSPKIEVLGLTTVFGNVTVDIASRNALALVELAKCDVPVAQGAPTPLSITPNPVSAEVHGTHGLGDVVVPDPKGNIEKEDAADFII